MSDNQLEINRLHGLINNNWREINRIDVDISALEQSLTDINQARDLFQRAVNEMTAIEADIEPVFKGAAAESFKNRLVAYRMFCMERIENMNSLYENYSAQIASLNEQKARSSRMISSLEAMISRIRQRL